MNNLQPYEKQLADNLRQVPVPDKDEGWKEMRKLLDRDLPEGGTGWGGNRKWWWMGITVAIIITGLWLSQRFKEHQNSQQMMASDASTIKKEHALSESSVALQSPKTNDEAGASKSSIKINPEEPAKNREISSDKKYNQGSTKNIEVINDQAGVSNNDANGNNIRTVSENFRNGSRKHEFNTSGGRQRSSDNRINGRSSDVIAGNSIKLFQNTKLNNKAAAIVSAYHPNSTSASFIPEQSQYNSAPKLPENMTTISVSIKPSDVEQYNANYPAEWLPNATLTHDPLKAEPGKTDKEFAKEMRKKSIGKDNRKMSNKSMRGISSEPNHELTFAAGLSLPQSFAIGSQQSPAYGVNAKPGTISDYVPIPYFQYHLNNKFFLQTELQFQAPQFTDKLLISQSQRPVAPTNGMLEQNIYIEKLYYFHIPLNIYFSPVRNVYIGSGIQYSSLLSGVATYQDNSYNNGTLQHSYSRVQGFKDDSVAAKLSSSEWRYQFEANYYFKRFTLGARYNQALSQFVNLQPSASLPFTQGRNQSFLISLRYNIWEERKKTAYYTNSW